MPNHFKLKKITNLNTIAGDETLPESDFSMLAPNGNFVQFDLHEEDSEKNDIYVVKPGIYRIATESQKYVLKQASFTQEPVLEDYISTKDITDKITIFFSKLDVYEKFGLDPKRALLLFGKPGCGKSQAISKVCTDYAKEANTLVVIWPSDKYEARHVKDFIKTFHYETNNVKRFILVIEDLGGGESEDTGGRYGSPSSLLSLLDNVERTFTQPTFIIATTNYPEKFLENLIDRPQRFDDVMEVKPPSSDFRAKFLEFFSKGSASEEAKEYIKNNKFDGFSIAHVKEIVIRSAIYDLTMLEAMDVLLLQSQKSKKGFTNSKGMGIGSK